MKSVHHTIEISEADIKSMIAAKCLSGPLWIGNDALAFKISDELVKL